MAALSFQPYATLQQQSMVLVGEPMEITLINFEVNTFVTLELVSTSTGAALPSTPDVTFESTVIPTSNVHVVFITFLQTTYVMAQDEGLYVRASCGNTIINSGIFHVVFNVSVCNGSVKVDLAKDVHDIEFLMKLLEAFTRLTDKLREEIHHLRMGVLQNISQPDSPTITGLSTYNF